MYLELKDTDIVEKALDIVRLVDYEAIVSSFDADAIRRVHADGGADVELAYVLGLRPAVTKISPTDRARLAVLAA